MDLFQKKITQVIGIVLGLILFIALIAGISYAYISYQSENINITGASECFDITYEQGQNITNADAILFDEKDIISDGSITLKSGMAYTTVSANIKSTCNIDGEVNFKLNVSQLNDAYTESGKSTGAFKYAIASYTGANPRVGSKYTIIKTGSITSTGTIDLGTGTLTTTSKKYMVIFYVDGNLAMDDAQDSTFSASLEVSAVQIPD